MEKRLIDCRVHVDTRFDSATIHFSNTGGLPLGYTHYYYRTRTLDPAKFALASADCKRLCDAVAIPLQGDWTKKKKPSQPEFSPTRVGFNGVIDHEDFILEQVYAGRTGSQDEAGRLFAFCKTACKPYDLCVTACILIFKHYFGEAFTFSSDGDAPDWEPAVKACEQHLPEHGPSWATELVAARFAAAASE